MNFFELSIKIRYSQNKESDLIKFVNEYLEDPNHTLEDKTHLGETLLNIAAEENRLELTKYLLEKGANPNHRNRNGYTSLALATHRLNTDMMKVLLEGPNYCNQRYSNVELTRLLDTIMLPRVNCPEDPDSVELLTSHKGPEAIKLLISHGADMGGIYQSERLITNAYPYKELFKYLVLKKGSIQLDTFDWIVMQGADESEVLKLLTSLNCSIEFLPHNMSSINRILNPFNGIAPDFSVNSIHENIRLRNLLADSGVMVDFGIFDLSYYANRIIQYQKCCAHNEKIKNNTRDDLGQSLPLPLRFSAPKPAVLTSSLEEEPSEPSKETLKR